MTQELEPDELTALWKQMGVSEANAETIGLTLAPAHDVPDPYDDLPCLIDPTSPRLVLADVLAEGGMAIIRRAHQRPLQREVAVKSLKHTTRSARTRGQLLREGRIAGGLEHPNVIPIHALGLDHEGEPMLVMKRVDGISWREFLRAPDARGKHLQGDTPLEQNLDVLLQVARATEYAHRQGVVHRDLKPDNVMIGEFGEVYLLDWGIALRLRDGVAIPDGLAGTPAYMAPEMVGDPGHVITRQTDVYLLGAVLSELLTGHPPHRGRSLYSAMLAAYRSHLNAFPEDAPPGLVQICRRAMQREPSERFASVGAFRDAVADWLRHRESHAVADEASVRLHALRDLLAEHAPPASVYRYFGAARFGFEQAMRIWPENAAARVGLHDAVEAMAWYEVAGRNCAAAEALVADLAGIDGVPDDLRDALATLQARTRAETLELASLRAMERDLDADIGATTRRRVAFGLGGALATAALVSGALVRTLAPAGPTPMHHIPHAVALLVLATGFILLNRRTMLQNRINRQISQMALATFGAGCVFRVLVAVLDIPLLPVLPLELLIYAFGVLMMGLATSKRVVWSALPLAVATLGCALLPRFAFEWTAAGVLGSLLWMAGDWKSDRVEDDLD